MPEYLSNNHILTNFHKYVLSWSVFSYKKSQILNSKYTLKKQ